MEKTKRRKTSNIHGQKFFMLTAIKPVIENNRTLGWEFLCDCGNVKLLRARAVMSGDTKSCGCYSRERENIEGQRFGRLVALEIVGKTGLGNIWKCLCDCGNYKDVKRADMSGGKVVSCGCRRKELLSGELRRGIFKEGAVWKTKEYYRDWKRDKRKNDPLYGLKARMTSNLRSSLKFIGVKKSKASFDILGYSPEELYRHIERSFAKGMTWENRSEWHIDHIIPLSTAKTEDDLISLNQLSNLRPMWAMENIKKANKVTTLL